MANNNLPQLKSALNAPSVKAKFEEMLGKRAPQFITSITSVVSNNSLLQKADVNSIILGAATAATLDLPLNPSLGYAALVPFNSKDGCFAQLQIMVKGWTELFLRSGQCKNIICETVYEGQLVKKNRFTGEYMFDEDAKKSDKIIGFMAYLKLSNGFEKYEYMTVDEIKAHAARYSQTYKSGRGVWKDNWEEMAKKTVLKKLLTRWAPKSIEMQNGAIFDQGVVKGTLDNINNAEVMYYDNDAAGNVVEAEAEVVDTSVQAEKAPDSAIEQARQQAVEEDF